MTKTLVLGIGNTLLSDEGVGVHVVEFLRSHSPEMTNVTLVDGGTLSFTLAGLVESHANLIVVDAARLNAEPGTVEVFEQEAMDRYLTGNRESVHEVGLMDLLDIAKLAGHYPRHRALIGIQPSIIDWGESPSEKVKQALPKAAKEVIRLIASWR